MLFSRCRINEQIEVEVKAHFPYISYTYLIIGRGKILDMKTIRTTFEDSDEFEYVHCFSFLPNFDYAPKVQIIIYCVRNESIVSTKLSLELYDDFKNFIDLEVAPDIVKPAETIDIEVRSSPSSSYIGLLGIDQSVLLMRGGNDLARDEIWNELEMFYSNVKPKSFDDMEKRRRSKPLYRNAWEDFSVNI